METWAFEPLYLPGTPSGTLAPTLSVTATTTAAASGQFPGNQYSNDKCEIQIANSTNQWAYVNFGTYPNVTAATVATGFPVPPGAAAIYRASTFVSQASVILSAASTGGTTVMFTRGTGI